MKFYFTDRVGGTPREMTMDEVHQHLSEGQIREAIEAKQADPNEGALKEALGDDQKAYFECSVEGTILQLRRRLRHQHW